MRSRLRIHRPQLESTHEPSLRNSEYTCIAARPTPWTGSMGIVDVCNIVRSFTIVDHRPLRSVYLFAHEKTIDTSYLKMLKPATHVVGYFRKSGIFRYVFSACH